MGHSFVQISIEYLVWELRWGWGTLGKILLPKTLWLFSKAILTHAHQPITQGSGHFMLFSHYHHSIWSHSYYHP